MDLPSRRSSNKMASSSSAISRSKSRRLISGRSRSPCQERENQGEGTQFHFCLRRHATGLGQTEEARGCSGAGGSGGETEVEKAGLWGQKEADAGGLGQQKQDSGLRLHVQGVSSPQSLAYVWAPPPGA